MSGIGAALLNSLDIGLLLFIIAVGLNIVFGVLNIINFAHGALYMLGAYLAFTLINIAGMPFWAALILAPIGVAILAVIIDRLLLRFIYSRDVADSLLLTFAILLIINESVRMIWGSGIHVVQPPDLLSGSVRLLGSSVATYSLFVIVIGLLLLAGLWYLFNRTRVGRIMRAAALDRDMAEALCINTRLVVTGVFAFGAWLAAVGGVMAAPMRALDPGSHHPGPDSWLRWPLPAGSEPAVAVRRHGAGSVVQTTRHYGQRGKCMKTKVLMAILAVVIAGLIAVPWIASYFYVFIFTEILILGLFAASFNLIFGYTGMLSFGHAAFFGIGAYATALVLIHLEWPFLVCLLVSMGASALLALMIGFLSVRLNEVYFAMLTLAFGMMVFAIAYQWRSVTNGSDGLAGFTLGSFGLGLDLTLANPSVYYHVVLGIVAIAAIVLYLICRSSFGMILKAIRQNPERVSFAGLNVRTYRLVAFVIAGTFAGLAGGLIAPFLRVASPELLHWSMSAEPILMAILGGTGFFLGPFIGSAAFVLLETWITTYTESWMLVLGIILALMVIFFRKGLLGTAIDWWMEVKK